MLHRGFNINERDNDGRTPLSWATQSYWERQVECVNFILAQEGVNVGALDHYGKTPLDWAKIKLEREEWDDDGKKEEEGNQGSK